MQRSRSRSVKVNKKLKTLRDKKPRTLAVEKQRALKRIGQTSKTIREFHLASEIHPAFLFQAK